jgi:manganese transport protein
MGVKQPLQPSKFRDWQGPSVEVQPRRGGWRTFLQVLGPAYLVAIGYMDPGNWATDLAAGSTLGYRLLWVVALSSLMATLLQSLCCRLGIAGPLAPAPVVDG